MDLESIDLASDIAEDVNDLICLKDQVLSDMRDVSERKRAARMLANGEPIETPEGEMPNYGFSHRAAESFTTSLEQLVLGTNDLCETIIDMDDPEQDARLGKSISNIFNKHIFNRGPRFNTIWRKSATDGYIVGGGAFHFEEQNAGVYPKFSEGIMFPKDTPLHAEGVTFAVEEKEVTLNELRAMLNDEKNVGKVIDREKIESLIEGFEENLGDGNVTVNRGGYDDHAQNHYGALQDGDGYGDSGHILDFQNSERSVREGEQNTIDVTLKMWRHWEVRVRKENSGGNKKGERYVSTILYIDDVEQTARAGDGINGRCLIIQDEEAFERAEDWLIFSIQDEEHGGGRTVGTIKGLAEVLYSPAIQAERLADRIIEGSLLAASPLLKPDGTGNPDHEAARNWDPSRDRTIPEGWMFEAFPNMSRELIAPFEMLLGVVAQNSSADRSNGGGGGGELRQQALERQRNNAASKAARILRNYRTLDCLLQLIVAKTLTADPVVGSEDYCLIKLVQELVDEEIAKLINLEDTPLEDEDGITDEAMKKAKEYRMKIMERRYGFLTRITVTAKRNATGLDRASEMEQARQLLELLQAGVIPEQLLPEIIRYFIVLSTGNPDWAAVLDDGAEDIMRSQRLVAGIEQQIIMDRAPSYQRTGEGLPTAKNDIHSDHLESDFNTVIGFIERHASEPLTAAEHIGLSWILVHDAEHIAQLRRMPQNNGKVKDYENRLQQLQEELQRIAPEVTTGAPQQPQSDQEALELAERQAKVRKLNADATEKERLLPLKENDLIGTDEQRKSRQEAGKAKDDFRQNMEVVALQDRRQKDSFDQQVTVEQLAQKEIETQERNKATKPEEQ